MPLPAAKQAVLRPSAAAAGSRGAALSALELEDSRPLLSGKLASRSTDSKEPSSKPARTSRRAWAACAALVAVYLSAYLVGLQGGSHSRDLAFINAHLNAIGRSIVVAIAAFTAALWATRLVGSAAWTARAALAAVHVLLLVVDHGQDFQYHGFYNWCAPVHCGVAGWVRWLCSDADQHACWWRPNRLTACLTLQPPTCRRVLFLIIATPLNLALLGLFLWYTSMKPRRFYLSLAGSAGAAALIVALALVHFQHLVRARLVGW